MDATRYRYLDTVRAYALEKFADSPVRDAVLEAHLDWYVGFAETMETHLYDARQLHALDAIGGETDNLRAALDRALQSDVRRNVRSG